MKNKALVLGKRTSIDWSLFEDSLHETFGVNAVTFNNDGERKTSGNVDMANDICCLIKKHPKGTRCICDLVQRYLNQCARIKKRYVTEECPAGMYKLVVPVIQADDIVGFISTCGRPFISTDRIYTHYIHKTISEDETTIENLLATLDPISPRTIKEMIGYITSYS
jgi:ligand-binding sensor protein